MDVWSQLLCSTTCLLESSVKKLREGGFLCTHCSDPSPKASHSIFDGMMALIGKGFPSRQDRPGTLGTTDLAVEPARGVLKKGVWNPPCGLLRYGSTQCTSSCAEWTSTSAVKVSDSDGVWWFSNSESSDENGWLFTVAFSSQTGNLWELFGSPATSKIPPFDDGTSRRRGAKTSQS